MTAPTHEHAQESGHERVADASGHERVADGSGPGLRDRFGVPVGSSVPAAVAAFDEAVLSLVRMSGNPVALAEQALSLDNGLDLARALRAYLHLYTASEREAAAARELLAGGATSGQRGGRAGGGRAGAHLGAARAWAGGDLVGASRLLEAALLDDPRDLLALRIVADLYLQLGDRSNLRNAAARVLPAWPEESYGAGFVRAMHAFGLEECGEYGRALGLARSATEDDGGDVWAWHAVLHVHEMEGRPKAGLEVVAESSPLWAGSFFAVHNWWHAALFDLELGDDGTASERYDGPIRHGEGNGSFAASLLWRLSLVGADLGERPAGLVELFEPAVGDSTQAFNDWHAAMAFGLAGRGDLIEALVAGIAARRVPASAEPGRAAGLELVRAFDAFSAGRPGDAVEQLGAARRRARRVGGSNAQRDVLDLTLLAAASAAGEGAMVRALTAERCAVKASSAQLARRVVDANRPPRRLRAHPGRPAADEAAGADALEGLGELALLEEDSIEAGIGWYGAPCVRRVRIETHDGAVSALVWGEGPPEVVLLHGAALNAHTWDTVSLALRRPLVALDLPGHGESAWRPDGYYDATSIGPAVLAAVRALTSSPVTLVGQSLGGLTAIEVTKLGPEVASGLVLVDVSPGLRAGRSVSVRSFLQGPQVFESRAAIVERAAAFGYGRTTAALERGVWHNTARRDDGSVVWKHHLGQLPAGTPRETSIAELWGPLEAFEGEVLLVWAEGGFLGEEEAEELTQRVRHAAAACVPGGHNVQESEPLRLAALIRGFLERGGAPA